jgi:hypothetical protein
LAGGQVVGRSLRQNYKMLAPSSAPHLSPFLQWDDIPNTYNGWADSGETTRKGDTDGIRTVGYLGSHPRERLDDDCRPEIGRNIRRSDREYCRAAAIGCGRDPRTCLRRRTTRPRPRRPFAVLAWVLRVGDAPDQDRADPERPSLPRFVRGADHGPGCAFIGARGTRREALEPLSATWSATFLRHRG